MNNERTEKVIKAFRELHSEREDLQELIGSLHDKLKKQDSNYQELVNTLTNMVNNFNFENEVFCLKMSSEHRTLQQSFTRLAFAWIEWLADAPDRFFDSRNIQSRDRVRDVLKLFCESKGLDYKPSNYPSKWLSFI